MAKIECPKETRWIYIHEGFPGTACPVCRRLIGTYTVQDDDISPYDIPMHPGCVCGWRIEEIEGLTTEERDRLEIDLEHAQNNLGTVNQDIKDAEEDIEDYEDDIEDLEDDIKYAEGAARSKRGKATRLRKDAGAKEAAAQRIWNEEWDPDPSWTESERSEAEEEWIDRQNSAETLWGDAEDLRSDADDLDEDAEDYDERAKNKRRELTNVKGKLVRREKDLEGYKERKEDYEELIGKIENCLGESWLGQLVEWIAGAFRESLW